MKTGIRIRPFISYAREDLAVAKRLLSDLRFLGIEPWLDVDHLLGGQDWRHEVRRALRSATHVIAVVSHHSVNKRGFVQSELRYAIELLQEIPPGVVFVIPVRVDAIEPEVVELQALSWVDLFPSYHLGFRQLAKSLGLNVPPLQYLEVNTHYDLKDTYGERASVENIQLVQAHVDGIRTLLTRGIAGTGQVTRVTSNLGSVEMKSEGGVVSAITHLTDSLPLGNPVTHVLRYEGIDCFRSATETVAQNIFHRLHRSGIRVSFPSERPFRVISGQMAYEDTIDLSPQVLTSSDNTMAALMSEYPAVGARLILKWEW